MGAAKALVLVDTKESLLGWPKYLWGQFLPSLAFLAHRLQMIFKQHSEMKEREGRTRWWHRLSATCQPSRACHPR